MHKGRSCPPKGSATSPDSGSPRYPGSLKPDSIPDSGPLSPSFSRRLAVIAASSLRLAPELDLAKRRPHGSNTSRDKRLMMGCEVGAQAWGERTLSHS